jgi:hypothetical protein
VGGESKLLVYPKIEKPFKSISKKSDSDYNYYKIGPKEILSAKINLSNVTRFPPVRPKKEKEIVPTMEGHR